MTKWTNGDDEIFEDEDAARDRCCEMITEDDIKCPWCGSTNTNLDSIEDSFFEGSSCQAIDRA